MTAVDPISRPEVAPPGGSGAGSRSGRGSGSARGQARARRRGAELFIRDILVIIVIAVLVSVGIKTFLLRSFYIPSPSMTNTLQVNDRILVNELVPNVVAITRGDIVVFTDPGGWLPPSTTVAPSGFAGAVDTVLSVVGLSASDSNDHLVKRVIGLPGDKVVCCTATGKLTVNGVLLDEPYLNLPVGVDRATENDFSITVPKGKLWVMGDHRYESDDSAHHFTTKDGVVPYVPISDVVGRAFVITWPITHWTWLDDYPTVFAGVDKASKK